MPFVNWNEAGLEMGLKEMDDQHHQLIDQMNVIFDINHEKTPKYQIVRELETLASMTKKHFSEEEAYMESIKYAAIDTHKVIHKSLLAQLDRLLEEYKATGTHLRDEFFSFLKVWLSAHIMGIDKKYVAAAQTAHVAS